MARQRQSRWRWVQEVELRSMEESKRLGYVTGAMLGSLLEHALSKVQEICLRLDHLESAGDWLSRALVHSDAAGSHTGTLVTVLAEEIREKLLDLVAEIEKQTVEEHAGYTH